MVNDRVRRQPSERDLAVWQQISDDLLDWLYDGLTGRFQIAGHLALSRWAARYENKILIEVGCGHGHHLQFGDNHYERYVGLDIEYKFLNTLRKRFPGTRVTVGDAYALPFGSNSADCILSIYSFEHLRQLPQSLSEIRRVLKPQGELLIGLPAEGGLLYSVGRQVTSKPYMNRKYGIDYDAIVQWEHWNTYNEVEKMLETQFVVQERRHIPFSFLPTVHMNIIVCLRAVQIRSNNDV